jgi:hypothetical protein
MAMLEVKALDKPDGRCDFSRGLLEVLHLTGLDFAAATFEPRQRWSESIAPITGIGSCQVHHDGLMVRGRLHIRMDDGQEAVGDPGEVFVCPPGMTTGWSATSRLWPTASPVRWRQMPLEGS